jgi:multiple sugar transport system permease protein
VSKRRLLAFHVVAIVCSIGLILPLYWAFVASLGVTGVPPPPSVTWYPPDPQWQNYATVFEIVPMEQYLRNSLLVVALAVPLTLLVASVAGFSMAQLPPGQQKRLLTLSVVWLIIPSTAVWIFRFQLLRWLGLIDSLGALVIPAIAASNPLFVLLYYWSFQRIPPELFEVAQIDGGSAWLIWRRIGLPLVKPTTIAVTVLTFVLYWSDFVSPILYLNDMKKYTAPVGLQTLLQMDRVNWPILMAAVTIIVLPVLFLFLLLQRFFLHDLTLARLFDKN